MMKKYITFTFIVIGLFLLIPCVVNAESISNYRAKIKSIEAEKAEADSKSAAVQKKINDATAKINEITRKIVDARKEQENTRQEIENLKVEIDAKKEEIKDLVSFYQISDSDNFYLKFVFGADSFEDFIYRFAVAEQLTEANDQLVGEMNDLIAQNKIKVQELKKQEKELDKLNDQVSKQIDALGEKKRDFREDSLSADEEIAALNKQIAFFKKEGCSETQDVSSCSTNAPSASGFILPTPYGTITSWYGYRIHPIWGYQKFHDGVDIGASSGTKVMATATGKVIYAGWLGGFGNAIQVVHNVKGTYYTSLYGHLSSIDTREGAIVQRGATIGYVGSTGDSTGPHLHFQMMYGSGYGSTLNPATFVNIPSSW